LTFIIITITLHLQKAQPEPIEGSAVSARIKRKWRPFSSKQPLLSGCI